MFDTAMIVDGGLGAVRGVKALNAVRVAKLERQALQVAIKETVQASVAESKVARSTSNFGKYAEAERGITRNAGKGSSIEYGQLDNLNRPTGIRATIDRDMIGTGTKAQWH